MNGLITLTILNDLLDLLHLGFLIFRIIDRSNHPPKLNLELMCAGHAQQMMAVPYFVFCKFIELTPSPLPPTNQMGRQEGLLSFPSD